MPLEFETARVSTPAAPQRTDIACFVGYVGRRPTPVPPAVRDDLRAAGWIDGPWRRSAADVAALEQLPVVVESWDSFDQLFDWRSRPVGPAGAGAAVATCATYLGAAVRRFFAQGGRRALVIRAGDPWPFIEAPGTRALNREARLARLIPRVAPAAPPFDATNPLTWRGIHHLYGLNEVSLVCVPDLADACGGGRPRPR